VYGELLGRFDLAGRGNFNRGYLNLADAVADKLPDLSGDPAENVARLRRAFLDVLAADSPRTEVAGLQLILMSLAIDADIALDLHCDLEAVLHMYVGTPLWPSASDLSASLGSRATLVADDSGGGPFDEALSAPFWRLAERLAPAPIPPACLSATVELRGRADVSDSLAAGDADGVLRFLMRRGVVVGDPGPLPEPLCEATPLKGVDLVHAASHGIVSFAKAPGDHVEAGEVVAEIIDPLAEHERNARAPLVSRTSGILFARRWDRIVRPGQVVCKVAGPSPLPGRIGPLLED
jgi:predicted deacylase